MLIHGMFNVLDEGTVILDDYQISPQIGTLRGEIHQGDSVIIFLWFRKHLAFELELTGFFRAFNWSREEVKP